MRSSSSLNGSELAILEFYTGLTEKCLLTSSGLDDSIYFSFVLGGDCAILIGS